MSKPIPADPIELIRSLAADGTMRVWLFDFGPSWTKEDIERYIYSKGEKEPAKTRPVTASIPEPPERAAEISSSPTKAKTLYNIPLFSAIGSAILSVMSHEWQSAAEIADACERPANNKFYSTLGSLSDRGVVQSHQTKGWRLNPEIPMEVFYDL